MPKDRKSSFRTVKLLGKKAQELLENAKTRIKSAKKHESHAERFPEEEREVGEHVVFHFSLSSIAKGTFSILAVLFAVYLCYHLRDKLFLLLLAMFLSVVIDPAVSALERWKIPRGFAVFFVRQVRICY